MRAYAGAIWTHVLYLIEGSEWERVPHEPGMNSMNDDVVRSLCTQWRSVLTMLFGADQRREDAVAAL